MASLRETDIRSTAHPSLISNDPVALPPAGKLDRQPGTPDFEVPTALRQMASIPEDGRNTPMSHMRSHIAASSGIEKKGSLVPMLPRILLSRRSETIPAR